MLFNSFQFLFLFLPVVIIACLYIFKGNARYWVLILASLYFYSQSGREHAYTLIASVIWVYVFMDRKIFALPKNINISIAVLGPIMALVYYKYSQFLYYDVFGLGDSTRGQTFSIFDNIILPAGISFFTFQLVAYAIDRHRNKISEPIGLRNLIFFISFFPQLIAGPIVRYSQISDSLAGLKNFVPKAENFVRAIIYFTFGLAFKVLIADTIGKYIEPLIAAPADLGLSGITILVFSYTFQIYFDFYGYSLCAIGLASLFGFTLPDNFKRPYSTLNPREFWQRWHMTLSYWIRDYLYFPLGGNDKYIRNILIVFLACGLWHGAGFSFVVWGLYHAVLVGGYSLVRGPWDAMPKIFQWGLNFLAVSFGWLFFVFNLDNWSIAINSLFDTPIAAHSLDLNIVLSITIAALVCFFVRVEAIEKYFLKMERRLIPSICVGAGCALVMTLTIIFLDRSATFIYFRF